MPEMTEARRRFVLKARQLEREALEGKDWGQYIVVNLDTGYAYRSHHDPKDPGDLAWPMTTKRTSATTLLRRWDAAVKRRAQSEERERKAAKDNA